MCHRIDDVGVSNIAPVTNENVTKALYSCTTKADIIPDFDMSLRQSGEKSHRLEESRFDETIVSYGDVAISHYTEGPIDPKCLANTDIFAENTKFHLVPEAIQQR